MKEHASASPTLKYIFKHRYRVLVLTSSYTSPDILLTPPLLASLLMAGLVMPWMLSRSTFLWRLAPPLPSPLPPLPRPCPCPLILAHSGIRACSQNSKLLGWKMKCVNFSNVEWEVLCLLLCCEIGELFIWLKSENCLDQSQRDVLLSKLGNTTFTENLQVWFNIYSPRY